MTRMRTDTQENLSAREIEVLQLVYKGPATGKSARCCTSAQPR